MCSLKNSKPAGMWGKISSYLDHVLAAFVPQTCCSHLLPLAPELPLQLYKRQGHHLPAPTLPRELLQNLCSEGSSMSSVTRRCPLENIIFPKKPVLSTYRHMVLC